MSKGVQRLARIRRNVIDIEAAVAFYRDALGFSVIEAPSAGEHMARLQLGKQDLELARSDPPGRAYPPDSRSCDLWFQHLAIVVADMDAAYAQLHRYPFTPITDGGPQRLPPNTGSVTAFKFRDPDGHPLELLHFPPGTGDPAWQREPGLFIGMDHSAIAVGDTEKSVDFYTSLLGFEVVARSVNVGREQARLDALPADVRVHVVALAPEGQTTPHVELLGYEQPRGRSLPHGTTVADSASDQLVLEADALLQLVEALHEAGDKFVSGAPRGNSALARDPDGHLLRLMQGPCPPPGGSS